MVMELNVILVITGFLTHCIDGIPVDGGNIGIGNYHAGVIGNLAGQLIGGRALSQLHTDAIATADYNENTADKDEEPAEEGAGAYEDLGNFGDHLEEQSFPADYGGDSHGEAEFIEESAASAVNEHHIDFNAFSNEYSHNDDHVGFPEAEHHGNAEHIDFGGDLNHEIHSKPVPGIDHGKGAYSYSSTYEFKDDKAADL